MLSESQIRQNVKALRERVAQAARTCGRDPEQIKIIAVSKKQPPESILYAAAAGIRDVGENRVQEATAKFDKLLDKQQFSNMVRHYIGPLQTNKARDAVAYFDMIHSIEKIKQAEAVNRHCVAAGRVMPVLIQVDMSDEPTKHGVEPQDTAELIRNCAAFDHISIRGLMTIAPFAASLSGDTEKVRPYFRKLRELRDKIQGTLPQLDLKFLSMGMSEDFEVAIEEGANFIRVGTMIFGARPAAA